MFNRLNKAKESGFMHSCMWRTEAYRQQQKFYIFERAHIITGRLDRAVSTRKVRIPRPKPNPILLAWQFSFIVTMIVTAATVESTVNDSRCLRRTERFRQSFVLRPVMLFLLFVLVVVGVIIVTLVAIVAFVVIIGDECLR